MERLTEYDEHGNAHVKNFDGTFCEAIDRLAAYEDTGLTPEEVEHAKNALAGKSLAEIKEINGLSVQRMIELAQAEQEGRLVVLPCKVGDTIYILRGDVKNGYETVKKTHVEEVPFSLGCLDKHMNLYPFYYLTRAEAESAMKGASEE